MRQLVKILRGRAGSFRQLSIGSHSSEKLGALIELAVAHGVEWLICDELQQVGDLNVADREILLQAKRRAGIVAMRNCAVLRAVADLCRNNSLEVLFFKGAALSVLIHGHPAARRYCDIDLLVKNWNEAERLKQLLVEKGFICRNDWPAAFNQLKRRYHVEFQLVSPDGTGVDIHWRFFHAYFVDDFLSVQIQAASWDEFPMVDIYGVSVKTLPAEDCLLIIAAHHTMHVWNELRLVCDIAGLVAASPHIDYQRLFSRASETGSRRMLAVALNLAVLVLGLVLPLPAAEALTNDRPSRLIALKLYRRLMTGKSDNNRAGSMLLETACRDGWKARLKFLAVSASQPSDNDFRFIMLSPPWLWCYFIIRPLRQILTILGLSPVTD